MRDVREPNEATRLSRDSAREIPLKFGGEQVGNLASRLFRLLSLFLNPAPARQSIGCGFGQLGEDS